MPRNGDRNPEFNGAKNAQAQYAADNAPNPMGHWRERAGAVNREYTESSDLTAGPDSKLMVHQLEHLQRITNRLANQLDVVSQLAYRLTQYSEEGKASNKIANTDGAVPHHSLMVSFELAIVDLIRQVDRHENLARELTRLA